MTARKMKQSGRKVSEMKGILKGLPKMGRGSRSMNFAKIAEMPVTRYIAGGLALYGLVRVAMKVSDSYPQIGRFFTQNLENVEEKLRDWTGREEISDVFESRH